MWRGVLVCCCLLLACGGAKPATEVKPPAGDMPEFQVTRWINSEPLTPAKLRGKVVLVDFWP